MDAFIASAPLELECGHRRDEEKLTEPYARSLGGLLVREFGVKTAFRRRVDGLVLHEAADGYTFRASVLCWLCLTPPERLRLDQVVRGARVTLVQTKLRTLGMALLGQTLFGAKALEREHAPGELEAIALATAHEPVLEATLIDLPGADRLRVVIGSLAESGELVVNRERPRPPDRQPKPPAPELVRGVADHLGLGKPLEPVVLTSAPETAEAVFGVDDGLLSVHSVRKPVSLTLAGLVLAHPARRRRRAPPRRRRPGRRGRARAGLASAAHGLSLRLRAGVRGRGRRSRR